LPDGPARGFFVRCWLTELHFSQGGQFGKFSAMKTDSKSQASDFVPNSDPEIKAMSQWLLRLAERAAARQPAPTPEPTPEPTPKPKRRRRNKKQPSAAQPADDSASPG
jgi:hypothetical protein